MSDSDKVEAVRWLAASVAFAALMASLCYMLGLDYGRTTQALRRERDEARQQHLEAMRALRSCRVAEVFRRGD